MRKVNLYGGDCFFIAFLFTGYYMLVYIVPFHAHQPAIRMANRADHIYILFVSLLNILSYRCQLSTETRYNLLLEISFRLLLITSGLLVVAGFFIEQNGVVDERKISPSGVGLAFIAFVLFLTDEVTVRKSIKSA